MKNFFLLSIIISLFSCAEIVAPSGGSKDTQAPIAKEFKPKNNSTNFKGKEIEIKFDEFIKINSSAGNIIISPLLEKKPIYEMIGKKLKITFQEDLKNNTTYIINFGSSIKDYNEGNELKNFSYIFSTGDFIDSLKISGKIKNAFDNKNEEGILVGLYNFNEDSFLYKKPIYFAKTNKEGIFEIKNIKEGKYKIAALEDKNLNYIFDQQSERIGFYDPFVVLEENINNIIINIFENYEEIKIENYKNIEPNHIVFNFNKGVQNLKHNISTKIKKDIFYLSENKKEFHYWYNNTIETSIINFSINNEIIDSFEIKLKRNNDSSLFEYTTHNYTKDKQNIIRIDFPYPIKSINNELLNIKNKTSFIQFDREWENNKQTLILSTKELYDSIVLKSKDSCFTSFHNLKSKEHIDTFREFTLQHSTITVKLKEEENLVLELYDKNQKLIKKHIVSRETEVYFKDLKQGVYYLRIYKDDNKDSFWNTGNFATKSKAEKTLLYKELKLKDNWDKEISF